MNKKVSYSTTSVHRDYSEIELVEIAKKAGVNRSTFYLHYDNIYELLEETVERLHKEFIGSFEEKTPPKISSKEDAFLITEKHLVPYLNFCKKNKNIVILFKIIKNKNKF